MTATDINCLILDQLFPLCRSQALALSRVDLGLPHPAADDALGEVLSARVCTEVLRAARRAAKQPTPRRSAGASFLPS